MAAKQSIEVTGFSVHQLHDRLSIVIITDATDDGLETHVLTVPGELTSGDHLFLVARRKNPFRRDAPVKYSLRQRTITATAVDVTMTFGMMLAVLTRDEDDVQEPARLYVVK